MRTVLLLLLAGAAVVGCGADEGPSKCVEGATADCTCGGFLTGQQFCSGGVFLACSCGSSGAGGGAGFAGTGGMGGNGGDGGSAGSGATGGDGGSAGAGGESGTGVSGTGGTGGNGGEAGSAGTGGTGGEAGSAGTGGTGGDSGSGGTGGDSGSGGTGGVGTGEYLASCDRDLGNADCAPPLVCYRATAGGLGSGAGPGFCTPECSQSTDCPAVSGANFTCGSEGVCRAMCGGISGGGCPAGMTCSGDFGFGGRCNY